MLLCLFVRCYQLCQKVLTSLCMFSFATCASMSPFVLPLIVSNVLHGSVCAVSAACDSFWPISFSIVISQQALVRENRHHQGPQISSRKARVWVWVLWHTTSLTSWSFYWFTLVRGCLVQAPLWPSARNCFSHQGKSNFMVYLNDLFWKLRSPNLCCHHQKQGLLFSSLLPPLAQTWAFFRPCIYMQYAWQSSYWRKTFYFIHCLTFTTAH